MEKFKTYLERKNIVKMECYLFDEAAQNPELFDLFIELFKKEACTVVNENTISEAGFFKRMFGGGQQQQQPQQQPQQTTFTPGVLDQNVVPLHQDPNNAISNEIVPLKQVGLSSKVVTDFFNKLQNHPQIKRYFQGEKAPILQNLIKAWSTFKNNVKEMQTPKPPIYGFAKS